MKPGKPETTREQPLRIAPWGQIVLVDRGNGEPARLVETVHVDDSHAAAALSAADSRLRMRHPSFLPVLQADSVIDVGVTRAVRCELMSVRGTALADMLDRTGKLAEPVIAALVRDVMRGLGELHSKSLIAGSVSPDHLVLCPPGQEDLPPLRLVHAGLATLVAAARGATLGMDAAGFAQLHPTPEVVAPEVLAGQDHSAASDTYALCATIARCALGRHVHDAAQASTVRALAQNGLLPAAVTELEDWLPKLGTLVVRGLQPNPWARAGVLAELTQLCDAIVLPWPHAEVAERQVLAPWGRGSPLVPLAAYATSGQWAERWLARAQAGTPLRFDAVRNATQKQAAAQLNELPAENQIKLRAAMARLEHEKARTQHQAADRDKSRFTKVAVLIALTLLALVLGALGVRQVRQAEDQVLPEFHRTRGPKQAPPPRPKSLTITPEQEGER